MFYIPPLSWRFRVVGDMLVNLGLNLLGRRTHVGESRTGMQMFYRTRVDLLRQLEVGQQKFDRSQSDQGVEDLDLELKNYGGIKLLYLHKENLASASTVFLIFIYAWDFVASFVPYLSCILHPLTQLGSLLAFYR